MSDPNPDAQYLRGLDMLPRWNDRGPDVEARFAAALEVIRGAAEAGSVEAANYLGTADDTMEGKIRWASAAAAAGDPRAITSLLTDGDHEGAPGRAALAAARAGEAWAAFALARVYGMGMVYTDTGVNVATVEGAYGWLPAVADPDAEAARWRDLAIEAGFAPALLDLARDLAEADPARALALVRVALAGGPLTPGLRTWAERQAAELLDAAGAEISARLAERQRLADAGDAEARVWLADLYLAGEQVPRDLARARALYEAAAAQGEVAALRELGRLHEEGLGGPVDLDAARACYEQAAELGADRFARQRLAERFGLDWYAPEDGEE